MLCVLENSIKCFILQSSFQWPFFVAQIWKLYLIPRLSFMTEFTCLVLVRHLSKAGVLIPWGVLSGCYWEVKQILTPLWIYEFKLQASSKAWSCVTRLESLWALLQNHPVHARGSSISHPHRYPMTGRFWHH